jgi:hypothetical protein
VRVPEEDKQKIIDLAEELRVAYYRRIGHPEYVDLE